MRSQWGPGRRGRGERLVCQKKGTLLYQDPRHGLLGGMRIYRRIRFPTDLTGFSLILELFIENRIYGGITTSLKSPSVMGGVEFRSSLHWL
jgi:hypothetical protein